MFCYYDKLLLLSVLGLVLYEIDANKKWQVSLIVKYIKILNVYDTKWLPALDGF